MLVLGATTRDEAWLEGLELTARERAVVLAASARPSPWRRRRARSGVHGTPLPVEAVALAGARGEADPARRWIEELRHVRLQIGGDDLIAAGMAEGPPIGERLERTLIARLDGELADDRDAELRHALEGER